MNFIRIYIWIFLKNGFVSKKVQIIELNEYKDIVQIESSYGIAEVTFNLYYIIELKVTSKKKKRT